MEEPTKATTALHLLMVHHAEMEAIQTIIIIQAEAVATVQAPTAMMAIIAHHAEMVRTIIILRMAMQAEVQKPQTDGELHQMILITLLHAEMVA